MWVFVDTKFGETFSFDDLIYQSRVSDVKRRIEKSHGIPVSTQRLFFNGVELLKDNQLYAYRIRKNSRLLLEVRDDHVNNQMPQQSPYAIQGFVPSTSMASSNYGQVPPSHAASASFFNQDPRTMARSNQVLPPQSHASEAFFNQDRLVSSQGRDHVNNQMPQQSPYAIQGFIPSTSMASSNYGQVPPSHAASASFFNQDPRTMARSNQALPPSHASEAFFNQDRLVSSQGRDHVNNQMPQQSPYAIQGFVPSTSMASSNYDQVPPSHAASASFFNQDPRTMARSNQVLPPSHASEAFFNQDRLVSSDGQVIHQPDVLASFSADEFLARPPLPWTAQETKKMDGSWPETRGDHNVNIQDLSPQPPQKLTVTMTQYDKPGRDFLVDVNSSDNVKELRKQLEKYQLDLPAKGYFFLHKEMRVLDDEKSFSMNRVANGDTIVIVPERGPIEDFYT